MENFNPDTFDWNSDHSVVIINGKYMDSNLMGNRIQDPQYTFARNAVKWGYAYCKVCNAPYTLDRNMGDGSNHSRSVKHLSALNKTVKKKRHVYW